MPFSRLSVVGDAAAADVNAGKTFSSVTAGVGATGTLTNNGVVTVTPSTVDQALLGIYASGSKVAGDSDLVAGNIKNGINLFGIAGNVVPKQSAYFSGNSGVSSSVTISNMTFQPDLILITGSVYYGGDWWAVIGGYCSYGMYKSGSREAPCSSFLTSDGVTALGNYNAVTGVSSTGFTASVFQPNCYYKFYAVKF